MTQPGLSVNQAETQTPSGPVVTVSAQSARTASQLFNYGNIAAILVPLPLGLLWVVGSMIIYAMNRHHPNERVGHYTQQAAYRFYGITGFFVAAGAFIPGDGWFWYLVAWGLAVLVIVPWSIMDIMRIRRETWHDVTINPEEEI